MTDEISIHIPWKNLTKEQKHTIRGRRMAYADKGRWLNEADIRRNPRIAQRAKQLTSSAHQRALQHKVPYSLTCKWVFEKLMLGSCEITGLPFDMGTEAAPRGSQHRSNFVPTIDRIEPSLGYTPQNSRIVIWGYNAAKSTGTDEDVLQMAKAVVARDKLMKMDFGAGLVMGAAGFV